MKLAWPVGVAGAGAYTPERVVTNANLAEHLDTSDEWIVQRTGIRERRLASPEETTVSMAAEASRAAIAAAGVTAQDIDLIVLGTITADHPLPAAACELQHALGCRWIPAFDVGAACSGFVWSLNVGAQYVSTGVAKCVLVVGAETLSRITDMEDRGTAILFGDAAAGVVLRPAAEIGGGEMVASRWGADGSRGHTIWIPGGGVAEPACLKTVNERLHYMKMAGREVYKFAVQTMQQIMQDTAEDAGVALDDIKLFIPHQSNARIIESACERANVPLERVLININRYGNTSAASVPLAFHEAISTGRIERGDLVMLLAFGAGLTWGSMLLRY